MTSGKGRKGQEMEGRAREREKEGEGEEKERREEDLTVSVWGVKSLAEMQEQKLQPRR
jgi:hypothetical protein